MVWVSLPITTGLSVAQPPPFTCAGCATPHHQTKKTILFVCLSWHSYLLQYGRSLSPYPSWHALSDSNSSLLLLDVMSSQQDISPKRAWVGTPKEPEQEPQNRFSPLSTARPCHLLPLTHDPLLPILAKYMLVIFGPCACSTSVYVQNLPTIHALAVVWKLICTFCRPSLISYGVSYFLISHSLWLAPFRGRTLLDCGLFFFHSTLLLLSAVLLPFPTIPLCHSYCDVIRPKPARPLSACRLFFAQWFSIIIGFFITLFAGSCVPFISSWASLTHLLSLGILDNFSNSAFL